MKSLLILCLLLPSILSYKILMICSPPSKSHHNLCSAVTNILTEKQHEVTFITAYGAKNPKYKEVLVGAKRIIDEMPSAFEMSKASLREMFKMGLGLTTNISNAILTDSKVQAMLKDDKEKFDLVILEYMMNDNFIGFAVKYDCPLMILVSMGMLPTVALATSNPLSMAVVPHLMSAYPTTMNLWQRTMSTIYYFILIFIEKYMLVPLSKDSYLEHFPKESKIVPFEDLHKRIDGVLLNSHYTTAPVRPLLPNAIEVGGFHIERPAPLSNELASIMNNSKHGVILFSLGSIVRTKDMTPEMRRLFINTFSRFKETILWKFDAEIEDLPKNVIIQKWIPQTSILDHPNLKLFISHGGLLSCTEATHFGVPMVIIPVFGDQKFNAQFFTDRGQGLSLEYFDLTEDSLERAIRETLKNPKFKENALKAQKLYHDRPINPREHIAFQVEHIIRSRGGSHLSPPYLPRYSLLLLDVFAIILIPIIIIVTISCYCCKKICFRKSSNKLKQN